ncbi:hypothetical protein [Desulfovibrio inopinatus]|nr:hypothetical protein [Desulfovibrio inopinatus]
MRDIMDENIVRVLGLDYFGGQVVQQQHQAIVSQPHHEFAG